MPHPLIFTIKESYAQLKQLHRSSKPKHQPRLQMLILLKKENQGLSKIVLSERLGVDPNSIQQWRTNYRNGGLALLLRDERGGNRRSVITKKTHRAIKHRLTNPKGAIRSYIELKQWLEENYQPGIAYTTLNGYVKRKFGAKLKVARKSHIKKDPKAISAFKKNARSDKRTLPEESK
jgi:transposase